jgi:ubiquinone/menaquinone biosynthesis C-methylase UbiE
MSALYTGKTLLSFSQNKLKIGRQNKLTTLRVAVDFTWHSFQFASEFIMAEIFDDWPEKYDLWFETPMGRLIKNYESKLLLEMLKPGQGEVILDAGCGTGIFTADILETGARVVGLELALAMLRRALAKFPDRTFKSVIGDIRDLPFADASFHKTISITAIEFIQDAGIAVEELFRVTKPGGFIVVATLNSLSPWAQQRKAAAQKGHPLFRHAMFRSPDEMKGLSPVEGIIQTAIHFEKDDDPEDAPEIEKAGSEKDLDTGAFLAARWIKPGEFNIACII